MLLLMSKRKIRKDFFFLKILFEVDYMMCDCEEFGNDKFFFIFLVVRSCVFINYVLEMLVLCIYIFMVKMLRYMEIFMFKRNCSLFLRY